MVKIPFSRFIEWNNFIIHQILLKLYHYNYYNVISSLKSSLIVTNPFAQGALEIKLLLTFKVQQMLSFTAL